MSGSIQGMINSLKANSRRKDSHIPFDENKTKYKQGKPIHSKDLSPEDKVKLLSQLKANRKREDKLKAYKMVISLIATVVVIVLIIAGVKMVFYN